jgi:hypothetical protein
MKTALAFCFMALNIITNHSWAADTYRFQGSEPNFTVTIPSLPQIKMEVHPMHETKPQLRYMGSKESYSISILTPTADAGMTALDCASSILGSLENRPGVPDVSQIYLAKINEQTYAAIYASPQDGFLQLHAHFISSTKTHCIEVHASKISQSKDDVEPWFKGFDRANIEVN